MPECLNDEEHENQMFIKMQYTVVTEVVQAHVSVRQWTVDSSS